MPAPDGNAGCTWEEVAADELSCAGEVGEAIAGRKAEAFVCALGLSASWGVEGGTASAELALEAACTAGGATVAAGFCKLVACWASVWPVAATFAAIICEPLRLPAV